MSSFYDQMYEAGFDDPDDYMDYLESKHQQQYDPEEEDSWFDDKEPIADVNYLYLWGEEKRREYDGKITPFAQQAKDIFELFCDGKTIPDDMIDSFLGCFQYMGWTNQIDDYYNEYSFVGMGLYAIAIQERDSIVAVGAAYCFIRALAINKESLGLLMLINLIIKQLLFPQLEAARNRENRFENLSIKTPTYWRNICYYALQTNLSRYSFELDAFNQDNPALPDQTAIDNIMNYKDVMYGKDEEEKLAYGKMWLMKRFFSACDESLEMEDNGEYDELLYPEKPFSKPIINEYW